MAAEQGPVFRSMSGQTEIVRLLLGSGVDVNANPPGSHWTATPLHTAAIQGQTEIVALLLRSGADPQIRDRLHYATVFGWLEHARAPRRALVRHVAAMLANHAGRTG